MVRIDRSGAKEFLPEGSLVQQAQSAIDMLKNGTGAGSDFIGWVDLPVNYDKEEFSRIQKASKKIQSHFIVTTLFSLSNRQSHDNGVFTSLCGGVVVTADSRLVEA